jgi:hypothetical protein
VFDQEIVELARRREIREVVVGLDHDLSTFPVVATTPPSACIVVLQVPVTTRSGRSFQHSSHPPFSADAASLSRVVRGGVS